MASALAAEGDPAGASLEGWATGDLRAGALLRLEIYAKACFERLHDALREDYGALAATMGAEAFHDLATAYLGVHPPRHPSLRFAGERLAAFLAEDAATAPFRRRFPWAPDLAALEWALVDAFDAPDAPVLGREALAALPPERWAGLRLALHPAAQRLPLRWPVPALRRAWQDERPLSPPEAPRPTPTLVWRRDERVRFRPLEPLEAELLAAAQSGEPFDALCARAAGALGEDDAPAYAAGRLAAWLDAGLVARAESGPREA